MYRLLTILRFLILAWILTLFGFDEMCITAMRELFSVVITETTYYFVFVLVGLFFPICDINFNFNIKD